MTPIHNPPHPGAVLVECLDGLDDLAITDFALRIHLTRANLSQIIDGHAPITFDLAVRLENALGTSRKMWIGMQSTHDFWITEGANGALAAASKGMNPNFLHVWRSRKSPDPLIGSRIQAN